MANTQVESVAVSAPKFEHRYRQVMIRMEIGHVRRSQTIAPMKTTYIAP